jgi:hypothetical protein
MSMMFAEIGMCFGFSISKYKESILSNLPFHNWARNKIDLSKKILEEGGEPIAIPQTSILVNRSSVCIGRYWELV